MKNRVKKLLLVKFIVVLTQCFSFTHGDPGACAFNQAQMYYPDPENCQSFYLCNFGKFAHMSCPEGTLYNAALLVCDHPENVRCCQSPELVEPEPIDPDGSNEDGDKSDEDSNSGESWSEVCTINNNQMYYPDVENCRGFYICEFGELHHILCPEGTLYNAALLVCDHPENVRCSQSPELVEPEPIDPNGSNEDGDKSDEDSNSNSGESWSEVCTINNNQMYYPDVENCRGFYICDFGELHHVLCPEGTLYNAALLVCDHPENVRCSQTPEVINPDQIDPGNTFECTPNMKYVYYPDPESCEGYYICAYGTLKHHFCAKGTLFNSLRNMCDHPSHVEC